LADVGAVLPPAARQEFFKEASALIEREAIDLILPTSGFDILPYSLHKAELEYCGVKVAISDYDTIRLCMDKMALYGALKGRFDIIHTSADPNEAEFPCFVKPAIGKGSRMALKCENKIDLEYALSRDRMVIQHFLPGREYSVDVFSDLNGRAWFAVPRWRIETKAGIIWKGRIERNPKLENQSSQIAGFLNIKGPSCFQWKLDDSGKPWLIEINPRMGGGTILATLAGANFPALLLEWLENGKIDIPTVREITVLRYHEEVVVGESP
jgi:carbamoyl-phosphate synthase large subunit